jgi:hypothetical protein
MALNHMHRQLKGAMVISTAQRHQAAHMDMAAFIK